MEIKYGYIIGRFAPLTVGHEKLIDFALEKVDTLLIFVGSANKVGTYRNPFNIDIRIKLINEVYEKEIKEGKIILKALNDLSTEDDYINKKWGKYLIENVEKNILEKPYYFFYGEEPSREKWFRKEDLKNTEKIVIPRSKDSISATKVRDYIANGDKNNFEKYTNKKIHKYYEKLKEELLKIEEYKK